MAATGVGACASCGARLGPPGPGEDHPWHYAWEDCRAVRPAKGPIASRWLLHVSGGVTVTEHGPFATLLEQHEYKRRYDPRPHDDDGNELEGYRDDVEEVPGLGTYDDPESDTWIFVEVGADGRLHADS